MSIVLACDLGGTSIRAALVDDTGAIRAQQAIAGPASRDDASGRSEVEPDAWWDLLVEACAGLVAEAPALLREAADALDEAEFESLVIGSIGSLDPYALPGARGYRALVRRLRGSEGQVARLRADLLAADRGAFHELADAIEAAADPVLVVLGPRASLEAHRDELALSVRDPG